MKNIPTEIKKDQVNWDPIAAIIGSISIYFVSQYASASLIIIYPIIKHWRSAQTVNWLQKSAIAQFINILLIECFVLLMLFVFLRYRKTSLKAVGWNRRPKWSDIAYMFAAFGGYFVSLYFIIFPVAKRLIPALNFTQKQEIGFVSAHGPILVLVFVSLAILPPLAEETLVRGFLYTGLRTKMPLYLAALITSLMFAAAHLQLGSGQPALWTAAIDTFVLSLFLILIRQKTGSLYASFGLHFLKNSIAFAAIFIFHLA